MESWKLTRTGQPALSFLGRKIAEFSDHRHDRNRWYEIALYETLPDPAAPLGRPGVVVSVIYRTEWQGENDHHTVKAFGDGMPAAASFLFSEHNPIPAGIGFPAGERFAARQAALETRLRSQYAHLVSSVLDYVGYSESL